MASDGSRTGDSQRSNCRNTRSHRAQLAGRCSIRTSIRWESSTCFCSLILAILSCDTHPWFRNLWLPTKPSNSLNSVGPLHQHLQHHHHRFQCIFAAAFASSCRFFSQIAFPSLKNFSVSWHVFFSATPLSVRCFGRRRSECTSYIKTRTFPSLRLFVSPVLGPTAPGPFLMHLCTILRINSRLLRGGRMRFPVCRLELVSQKFENFSLFGGWRIWKMIYYFRISKIY